jgi:hypothetical protein
MLERRLKALKVTSGCSRLTLRPFEIKTLRCMRKK